jgi:hypothetical protein
MSMTCGNLWWLALTRPGVAHVERLKQLSPPKNACGLAQRFLTRCFDTIIVDVLTPATAAIYRQELPTCLIIHLRADLAEVRRRAATRKVWLTEEEFEFLHRRDHEMPPDVDARIEVAGLTVEQQLAAVADLWTGHR